MWSNRQLHKHVRYHRATELKQTVQFGEYSPYRAFVKYPTTLYWNGINFTQNFLI